MGRHPTELGEAQKAEVETLAAVLTTEQIADYFGIGRRTFYDLMVRDEEIAARYKKGKARAIGAIAQTLISKARAGDTVSMLFYLKTQGGWRETQAIEIAGQDGAPLRFDSIGLAPLVAVQADADDFVARMNQLKARAEAATPEGHVSEGTALHVVSAWRLPDVRGP